MKKTLLKQVFIFGIISATAVFYFSCDDAGVVKPENEEYCISGQITNWTGGSNKTLHARIYSVSGVRYSIANCPIDANGSFNLCLPSSVSDTTLFTSDSIFYSGCTSGSVTFSPPDVKGAEIYDFRVKSGDTTIGTMKKNNYDTLYPGAFSVMYIYVTKNVTVIGTKVCTSDTLNFDGSATTGWNKVVKHCTRTIGTGTTYLYNTSEPSGAVWKYNPF